MSSTRVLVVDDEAVILEAISMHLAEKIPNPIIKTADNGVKALLMVGFFKPRIIILDIKMPKLNGLEVASFLKEDDNTMNISIIAISGIDNKNFEEKAYGAGVDAFLHKPFNYDFYFYQ